MKIVFFGDSLTEGKLGASFFELLEREFPEYRLMNYGEGGDTVVSLYHRVVDMQLVGPFDLAVLWIGVNDVFGRMTWFYRILNKIRKKPFACDLEEFRSYYRAILEILQKHGRKIISVGLLFLGEDLESKWNMLLDDFNQVIQNTSFEYKDVEFVNIRERFTGRFANRKISTYLPTSAFRIARDKASLITREHVDRKSSERGLHFTLDGVHLNSEGAKIVSDVLKERIEEFIQNAAQRTDFQ